MGARARSHASVLEIDPSGNIVWQYGVINTPGNGKGELTGPYTAFVIGDSTGQTVPRGIDT